MIRFTAVDHETGNIVGTAQDEWGALLIVVAKEYRGFGIGEILGQLMRDYVPNYQTGGVTNAGKKNLKNVHSKIVSKAAANGQYSQWVKDGTLTIQQAKQILSDANVKGAAADLTAIETPKVLKSNAESELLWAWIHGSIIVYNKQLLTSIPSNFKELGNLDEYWRDRALDKYLVGMIYIGGGATNGNLNVWQFGGATEQLKRELMSVGLGIVEVQMSDAYVKVLDVIAGYVDNEKVVQGKPEQNGEILVKPHGYAQVVPPYIEQFRHEAQVRKQIDPYGEIIALIAEEATAKFDDYNK